MLRPGDVQFVNDEPQLLYLAAKCNHTPSETYGIYLPFTVSPIGLQGTRGARYGPLPVWVYQVLLATTQNPVEMVRLHAALAGGITALALAWLAATMGVSPWLAVVAMLSPWMWLYDRQLWDNNFCIPLSAMTLAAYADFLDRGRGRSLWLAALCGLCMLLVHLMCLAILAPLVIHLAVFSWRSALRFWGGLTAVATILGGLSWPYWYYLLHHYSPSIPGGMSPWAGWFYPLLGAHHLTAAGLGNILGDDWQFTTGRVLPFFIVAAQSISLVAYPAAWAGMILALRSWRRVVSRQPATTTSDHLATIALGTWICQSLLDGNRRVSDGPQYFNATWIAYTVFAWLAVDALLRAAWHTSVLVRLALPVYAAALLVVLGSAVFKIARDGGAWSENYGAALDDQLRAFAQLQQYSAASPRQISVRQWTDHPWVLDKDLPALVQAPAGPRPTRQLIVGYRSAFPGDARLMVRALGPIRETTRP
jgi:hypothetical protein